MVADTITIELELDDKQFTVRMNNASRQLGLLSRDLNTSTRSINRMERSITGVIPRLRDLTVIATMLGGGLRTLTQITFGWQKSIIDASSEIERLKILLSGMSREVTADGAARELAREFDFLMETVKTVPFSMKEVSGSFVKLKSVGIDPTKGALRALTDAVSNFGGDDQVFHRATVAIQQMAGKGVISMEELRQQLGEAVPNAMRLLAKSTGQSVGDMVERISTGQMEAKSALERLMKEFELTMGGSSERLMKTWGGLVRRMTVSWDLFKVRIGDTGFFDEAKKAVKDMTDAIDEGAFDAAGLAIGDALAEFTKTLTTMARAAADNIDTIMRLGKAIAIAFGGAVAIKAAAALIGTIVAVGRVALAARGGLVAFRVALMGALGPIAFIGTALAALVAYFWDLEGAAEDAADAVIRSMGLAANKANTEEIAEGAKDAVKEITRLTNAIEVYQKRIQDLQNGTKNAPLGMRLDAEGKKKENNKLIVNYRETLGKLQAQLETAEELQTKFIHAQQLIRETEFKRAVQARVRIEDEGLREIIDLNQKAYNNESNANFENLQNKLIDQEKYLNKLRDITAKREGADTSAVEAVLGRAKAELVRMENAKEDVTKDQIDQQSKIVEKFSAQLVEMRERYARFIGLVSASGSVSSEDTSTTLGTFEKYFNKLTEKINESEAGLSGLSTGLTDFRSKLNTNFKGEIIPDKAMRATEEMILQLERNKATLASNAKESQELATMTDKLADSARDLGADMSDLDDEINGTFKVGSSGQRGIEAMISRLSEMALTATTNLPAIKALKSEYENLLEAQKGYDYKAALQDMTASNRETEISLMKTSDQVTARYESERLSIENNIAHHRNSADDRFELTAQMYRKLDALNAKYARDSKAPIQKLAGSWEDATTRMGEATTSWLEGFSRSLADVIVDGKAGFKDLANSIVKDIIRIQIQKQIAGLISSFDTNPAATNSGQSVTGTSSVSSFAKGGIMSSGGQVPLNAYANGGVANSPQLALFGEGRMNEAYVPLPDGKTIPVTMQGSGAPSVQVNVINESGTQVEAEQGQPKFDGSKMILDVVLTAVGKPGPFRDGMKGSLR